MTKMIETERLILRPFKSSDAERYFEITRDEDILEYVSYACPESIKDTLDTIEKYYSKGDWIHDFFIILEEKENHELVGALIVTEELGGGFDTCLIVAREHRRKGYMSEALNAFIEYMPQGNVLQFVVKTDNVPALGIVQKMKGIIEITKKHDSSCIKNFRDFVLET